MRKTFYQTLWLGLTIVCFTISHSAPAQGSKSWTKKEASNWYNQNEWLNGLQVTPHKSIDKLEFAKQYHAHKDWWDKAFVFIKEADIDNLQPGTYPIDGDNVYAMVTESPSRDFDTPKWENHNNYIDIHYVLKGKELIGVGSLSDATIVVPYNETNDITFYDGKGKYYLANPGNLFIVFSSQIHRPNLKVEDCDIAKKLVIKVKSL